MLREIQFLSHVLVNHFPLCKMQDRKCKKFWTFFCLHKRLTMGTIIRSINRPMLVKLTLDETRRLRKICF